MLPNRITPSRRDNTSVAIFHPRDPAGLRDGIAVARPGGGNGGGGEAGFGEGGGDWAAAGTSFSITAGRLLEASRLEQVLPSAEVDLPPSTRSMLYRSAAVGDSTSRSGLRGGQA